MTELEYLLEAIDPRRESLIPDLTLDGLRRYAEQGIPTGSFLEAVLSNDLMEAVARADLDNMRAIAAICCFIYNRLPSGCHGSPERYQAWLAMHAARRAEMRTP